MRSNNFVVIQGWMCNELNLKGNELLVYALIYGFSQDEESVFAGSRRYISETFNISLPTVDKCLNSLVEKELIVKETETINGVVFNSYYSLYPTKKLEEGCKETLQGGGKETLPNNIVNRNIENNKSIINNTTTEQAFGFGQQKKQKVNLYDKCLALINDFTNDAEIRTLLIQFLNMTIEKHREAGTKLYSNVFKGKLRDLEKLPQEDWDKIITRSLEKGWYGFYELRKSNKYVETGVVKSESYYDGDYAEENEKLLAERRRNGQQTEF